VYITAQRGNQPALALPRVKGTVDRTHKRFRDIILKFDGLTIGVLGDYMLDELLQGEATRISPEAPVPVVVMKNRGMAQGFPGGAGNVAANLAALGGRPIAFGAIGEDESGERLKKLLTRCGIYHKTLLQVPDRVTPHKIRIAALHHQLLRLDVERPENLAPRAADAPVRSFKR